MIKQETRAVLSELLPVLGLDREYFVACGEFLEACQRAKLSNQVLRYLVTTHGRDAMDAAMQAIVNHWRLSQASEGRLTDDLLVGTRSIIEVPDLDAADLLAATEEACKPLRVAGGYTWPRVWNFWQGYVDDQPISGRGKKFEFLTWNPKRSVSTKHVRDYFEARGFYGHTGAFIAWVKEHVPRGYFATIPDDNGCCSGNAPYSYFGEMGRELDLHPADYPWYERWSFVAFRELP